MMDKIIHQLLRALAAALVCSGFNAGASPVLDYTQQELDLEKSAQLAMPQSVFHAWTTADAEAAKIMAAWESEPVTIPWTRVQLAAHIKHKVMPTRGARGLALVHVAMHDAYMLALQLRVDQRVAVSMAAAQVLGYLYVPEEKAFDRIAYSIAARVAGTRPENLPDDMRRALYLGYAVGRHLVGYGETDGAQKGWNGVRLQWYGEGRYYGPGSWEPTAPYFYFPPDEPFAHGWKTWVLTGGSEFRPTPPAYGSPKYLADLQEVLSINATLKPEQLARAKFWVDGHGSVTPPGHWNQIAIEQALEARLGDAEAARLFAQLNIAQADTFIAVWDVKYHYWTARPITAAKTLLGKELKTAILTPPFPSYVSGHAAFSGAAATILGAWFPANAGELERMAHEAALSRLLGGIHFRHDNDDGLVLGRKVATKVLTRFGFATATREGDAMLSAGASGGTIGRRR